MSRDVVMRRCESEDLDLVVGIFLDSWRGYRGLLPDRLVERWSEEEAREHWRAELAQPGVATTIAEREGEGVGFVRIGPGGEPRVGELLSLYVRSDHGGAGVGRALVEHAEEEMRAAGRTRAQLWVFAANEPARRFYQRLGWSADGRERVEPAFDAPEIGLVQALGPGGRMEAEMAQQPETLASLLARREQIAAWLRTAVPDPPRGISLLARGSSDNAAVYGRYALELALRQPVALTAPSLWTRYGVHEDLRGHLVVAASQSGRTPEILTTLTALREAGAVTVAITNEEDSPLADAAAFAISLEAGEELAVPATKTFSATLAAMAIVSEALSGSPRPEAEWTATLDAQRQILADPEPAATAARLLAESSGSVHLGRGPMFSVALEAALKVSEASSLPAVGFSSADFLHGPVAAAGPATPVVAYVAPGPVADDVHAAAAKAHAGGAPLIVVGDERRGDGAHVPTGGGYPEALAPIAYVVRAQQLALFTALARGGDPDRPPSLEKVTPTT